MHFTYKNFTNSTDIICITFTDALRKKDKLSIGGKQLTNKERARQKTDKNIK